MAKRSINSNIESHLINNEPFEYAHLVKFERPFHPKNGEFRTNPGRYVFLTDGARDITFDADGDSSAETYRANGIISIGSYSETTQARATNMTLSLAGETLGTSVTATGDLNNSGTFTIDGDFVDGYTLDFVEKGFREGDKIKVEKANGTNFADGTSAKVYIISSFSNDNKNITFARTGTDTDDSTFITLNSTSFTFTLINEEIRGALLDKGTEEFITSEVTNSTSITLQNSNSKIEIGQLVTGQGVEDETIVTSINGTSLVVSKTQARILAGTKLTFTNPNFINREVFIYKVFLDTDGNIVGNSSVLVFKGIINGTNIQENRNASRVQWNLSSHWGDFDAVNGRLTTDEIHRALDTNGKPNPDLADRPEYAYDLGFLHAETSLSTIAVYQTTETEYKLESKRRGGLGGLLGQKKYSIKEIQKQVDNEVDLSVFLQGKYLPVVYGVQRVNGIPIFADTKSNNSKEVYVVYAISEGENHGIYNLYIDGAPLVCIDKSDYDVRNTSATNSDSNQLQCYGRADQGGTLGGAVVTGSTNYTYYDDEEDLYDYGESRYTTTERSVKSYTRRYSNYNENDITETSVSDSAEGLQHGETASISHPYSMHFTFYSGRPQQDADNNLVTIAASSGFKRQSDYYSGNEAYWSPNHKLLDTAYAVMKFSIEADQTTVPDIEYVVKGKVLECHNYDGTYVPDTVLGASDNHTNFIEGQSVTVEKSPDGSTWTSVGTFRILDKYQFTTARNSQHYRFRLDSVPSLGTDTYVRLNDGSSNYWHMLTHNNAILETATSLPSQTLSITSLQTDSNGLLTATLPSATVTELQALYPNITSSASTSDAMIQFTGDTDGIFTNLKRALFQATLSGTTLTFVGTSFSANQSSTGTLSGINIQAAEVFDLSTISEVSGITNTAEIIGSYLEIVETGESRRITAFDATNDYVTIESAFITPPTSSNTFKIIGRGKDLRSSINPAIQTLDLLTNSRYGKGLDLTNDIDLDSVKAAALLCDTRSDVTMPLSSAASCGAGDIYKLTDDGTSSGNHVASGEVLNATSSSSTVVFTNVSGKFIRNYENYISYNLGDVVTNIVNGQSEYYRVTSGAGYKATAPSHTTGTVNGFEHLTTLTLHKVSGSGPSTLSVAKDGRLLTYSLYDSDFVKYWRYIGWEENRQWCVTRHQTNFIFDTSRSIFENINALLSHYNGILSYSNGKYVLDVETQVSTPTASVLNGIQSNPLYIDNDDIIGSISLVDNSQRNSKNTIKASIADPQNNFGSRSVSFFNSDFLKADRNKVKTGSFPFTGITSYYNARIGVEKELIQSRYSKEISFTVGPRGLLLKPGEVIALTYEPFGFNSKLFRIENLTYSANCNTQVKAREYDDSIYVITPQIASSAQKPTPSGSQNQVAPGTPTSLSASNTKPGIITLNWTNTTGNTPGTKDYKEITDSTEIWRASTQGSSGNIIDHAELITVVDNAQSYNDALGEAGTFYYWIRHRREGKRVSGNTSLLLTGDFSTGITGGVPGVAKVPSPQLDVDISSIQVKFDDANALSPTGAAQDVTLTATLRNITPNASGVIFTLVDADQSSQNDVQFTNGNATLTDTSSPYQATVDASTFEHTTTNKFVKIQVTDTSGEVFTELVSATVTKDGSSGSIGADAIAVKLEASQYVISYSAQGTETDTISLSTTLQGSGEFTGTPYYEFIVDGSSDQNSTTTTYTLPDGDEPAVNENKTITVKVRDGSTTGTVKATDSISVYGIESGSDSTTAFLTNSAHVVPTDENGTIDSSLITSGNINDAGGTFKVYIGTTDRTTSCTYTVQSESGVDATIGASTGVYTISSTGLSDYGVAVFRVTVPSNISPTGTSFTIDQTYTIAKSKKGNQGANGSDAKTVTLTASDYSIVYDADGANPDPSGTITLTATSQNFTDGHFKFTGDGITDETSYTDGTTANSDTFSFSVPSSHFTSPKLLRVGVSEGTAASTEIAFDTINIFAVKEGSNAYTVILDNEAHALPADENGANLDFTGTGCTIEVYKGSTELNGITSGTPTSGQFKVTASGTGITPSSTNGTSSGDPVIFADHSGMTGTSASITYTINIENIQTVLKKQTFTRVDKGATGNDAQVVKLSASSQIFELPKGSSTLTPSSITFTASRQNISNSTTFTTNPIGINLGGSGDTRTLSNSDFGNNTAVTITATAGSFSDEITVVKVEEGTDAITAVLGNESHTFQANNAGTVSDFSGGTTTIQVFEGATALTFTTGTAGNGQFTVSRSASGITQSGFSGNNTTTCTTNAPTAMSGDSATITYTITGKRANGTAFTLTKVQSFSKSKSGADGSDGDSIKLLKIYLQKLYSQSQPSTPTDDSYNFATDTLTINSTNTSAGWTQTLPTFAIGYVIYECEKIVSGTSADTNVTVDWPAPSVYNPFFDLTPNVYKRSATTPSTPSSGTANPPSGWSSTIPSGTDDVWQSAGTGSWGASGLSYTWSAPTKITGDQGDPGNNDPRSAHITIFNPSSAFSITGPTDTTTGTPYNFETGVLTIGSGGTSGWTNTRPSSEPYWTAGVKISESSYDGAQNVDYLTPSRVGKIRRFDDDDFEFEFDGTTRVKYRFSSSNSFINAGLIPTDLKNSNISITSGGVLQNAGGGTLDLDDITDSGNTKTYAGRAGAAIDSSNRVVGNLWNGSVARTPAEIIDGRDRAVTGLTSSGVVQTTVPVNKGGTGQTNSNTFLNSGINISQGSGGVFTLNRGNGTTTTTTITKSLLGLNYADGADVTANNTAAGIANQGALATRSDVRAGTHIKDSGGTILGNDDIKNSSLDVDISGTAIKLKIGNTETSSVTATQALVGLSGVQNNADPTSSNTAAGIANQGALATRSDVLAGSHIKNAAGSATLGDADIITSQGTSNDTSNVSGRASATVKTEAQVGNNAGINFTALVDDLNDPSSSLNITGERITGGVIEGSLIKTDELNLITNGTSSSGVSITVNSTMSSDYIADLGTGAGMYMGGISVGSLTGSSIRGASIHLDIRAGSSSTNLYSKYFPIGIKESNQYYDPGDGYESGEDRMNMEFMYFYTGTETLKAYITADSNGTSSGLNVTCRAVKFGAEQPNSFTFTDETGLTAASNETTYETSNTITLSGFTGTLTASVSGHSSAQMSINSGTFTSSDTSVSSGNTIQLRILKPSSDATTRSATLNVGGVQDTYSITTSGTYVPDPGDSYGCFAEGSLIWCGDGNYKPIEQIKVGNIVMTYNQEINGFEPKEVTYTMTPKEDEIYKFTFWENDKELYMTDAHPILGADHKWYAMDPFKCLVEHHMSAEPLTQNTELLYIERELMTVSLKNIEMVGEQTVYNLSRVTDNENFIVDGFVAHNVRELKP